MPRVAEEQLTYTMPPEQRGFYELASAILTTAVKDYRHYRKMSCETELENLRDFFMSDIFENISGIANPNSFLLRLDEQIDKELYNGMKRKREKRTMKCNR